MTERPAARAHEVRFATAADEPALQRIDIRTRSARVTPAPSPHPERLLFGQEARARPENTLVVVVDAEPAGYVALARPSDLESHSHVLEVCALAVAPEAQGRGIGRALVEAAIEEARRRGSRRLTLRVLSSNPAAQRLYEACGFRVEGVLRGEFRLEGAWVDDVLMARELEPEPA